MEREKYPKRLESRVIQFIDEGVELGHFSIKRAAHLYFELVGSSASLSRMGYVQFLKATGLGVPMMDDLNGRRVGRYWEFITQHHGVLASQRAMAALRAFWIWASMNGWTTEKQIPADLSPHMKVAKPYRVRLKIKETE